ncbi:MAG: hypothetical protein RIM72_01420 [Alphaproteobacteria bacterium]
MLGFLDDAMGQNPVKTIQFILVLYSLAWLIAANFDFVGSDSIVAYEIYSVESPEQGWPNEITLTPTLYRIIGQSVVAQVGTFPPTRHNECAVIDMENWECKYSDGSGIFGFSDGDYYQSDAGVFDDLRTISRFEYIVNNCKWSLAAKDWMQKAVVLFAPFLL